MTATDYPATSFAAAAAAAAVAAALLSASVVVAYLPVVTSASPSGVAVVAAGTCIAEGFETTVAVGNQSVAALLASAFGHL